MNKVVSAGLAFLSLAVMVPQAYGSRIVIDELRKLKASLPVNDPARSEITLRLADRLADEYLVGKGSTQIRSETDRTEAISLYQETLPARSGEGKIKIQFQLARLFAEKAGDESAQRSARDLFEQVRAQTGVKELKRESTLRLAEIAESSPKTAATAVNYYRDALQLCEGTDSCSYSHYRLGWIERNHENLPQAIEEMKMALWDSKGQIREEALRDLVSFMGLSSVNPDQNIAYLDQLGMKLARPTLLQDLSSAYFAAGNKSAAVKVLALTHSRTPTLLSGMRLMEEYYGLRQWDAFRAILTQFQGMIQTAPLTDSVEVEKIGRRLATQLDGERTTDPSRFDDFKQFTLSYLNLFPLSNERAKIMEGLIAAEPNADLKLSQLKSWLGDSRFALPVADQIKLQELRAAIAQKQADQDSRYLAEVEDSMNALIQSGGPKLREYRYVRARTRYARKDFANAVSEFSELAQVQSEPDTWAIQSQHLILDIYNQQKDFTKIIVQSRLWTSNESLKKNTKIAKDLQEMNQIAEQAEFEAASTAGETPDSLKVFLDYCKNGKFLPKSCDNAKVLAVKLNQHPSMIAILELRQAQDPAISSELMDQYEEGGYFAKAAGLMEKANASKPDFKAQVKTALLYEILENASRDRSLKQLSQWVMGRKLKLTPAEEKAFLAFLNDSRLLNPSLMTVMQAADSKAYLAEALEEQHHGNASTLQALLGFTEYQGPAWSSKVIEKTESLSREEAKIKFYGRNGQVAFQKRVSRLKELNQFAEKYLNGSDSLTRTKLLAILKESHDRIGIEILESPIPQGLSDEQVNQVKESLAEMAKPFQDKAASLKTLLETENQKVSLSLTQSSAKSALDEKQVREAIEQLHLNPKNTAILNQLKTLFANAGMSRPAAYFEGRIQGL